MFVHQGLTYRFKIAAGSISDPPPPLPTGGYWFFTNLLKKAMAEFDRLKATPETIWVRVWEHNEETCRDG